MRACLEKVQVGDCICYATDSTPSVIHKVISVRPNRFVNEITMLIYQDGLDSIQNLIASNDHGVIKNLKIKKSIK